MFVGLFSHSLFALQVIMNFECFPGTHYCDTQTPGYRQYFDLAGYCKVSLPVKSGQPLPYDHFLVNIIILLLPNIRTSVFSVTHFFVWFAAAANETPAAIVDSYWKTNLKSKTSQNWNAVKNSSEDCNKRHFCTIVVILCRLNLQGEIQLHTVHMTL